MGELIGLENRDGVIIPRGGSSPSASAGLLRGCGAQVLSRIATWISLCMEENRRSAGMARCVGAILS